MNDEYLINELFSYEQIENFKKIRNFQNMIGKHLEDYINSFPLKQFDIEFVGRNKSRPTGVDYIIGGEYWAVKNAWNTENSAMKKFRENLNIKHWYRLNKDNSTNWHTFFINGPEERGFIDFLGGKQPSSLEMFFD